jgi:hypothetical protein
MRPKLTLFVGIGLLILGAFLYTSSNIVVTVYDISSGSYWTYYEYQYATHPEYQCMELGVGPLCALFYHFTYAFAVALYLAGAVTMAVSLYRLTEGPRST